MNSQVIREISPEGTSGLWRVGQHTLHMLVCCVTCFCTLSEGLVKHSTYYDQRFSLRVKDKQP